jgi:hypothetical protein
VKGLPTAPGTVEFNPALAVLDQPAEPARISRLYRFKFEGISIVTERNKYHREALHCVRTAEHMRDPGERAKLLEIARAYLGLARHVSERQDRATTYRPSEPDPRLLEDA